MFSLIPLSSGSKGNATLVRWPQGAALIDCGLTVKELNRRLTEADAALGEIKAIFITHEHRDHIAGAPALARTLRCPVFLTHGTARSSEGLWDGVNLQPFYALDTLTLPGLKIKTLALPHDAKEPVAYTFETPCGFKAGYLTDCGTITQPLIDALQGCRLLALEANHCPDMLADGPYPQHLKRRVGGPYGHLSNQQAASLLKHLTPSLEQVCLMHLSEHNNTPTLAHEVIRPVLPAHIKLTIAQQHTITTPLTATLQITPE